MATKPDVELVAVTKRFGETAAVDSVSLRIPAGSYCCLLGPSGCGKTTTLRMIAGHEEATEGDIILGSENITHLPPAARGGLNFGGGIEYFVGDRASVKGEARWDVVSQPAGFSDATGFTITIGYKRYF